MTGFDIAVLVIVGLAAVTGFMRGFVQECLILAGWIIAVVAIHALLAPTTTLLLPYLHSSSAAAVLAFAILLIVPLGGMKLIAGRMGSATRNSLIGPIDRVLGFGFGAIKGTLVVVVAFAVVTLGYDVAWGRAGRPTWITASRSYPFINACSDKLVSVISERRREAEGEPSGSASADEAAADAAAADAVDAAGTDQAAQAPLPRHHRRHRSSP